jgi:integrase
MVYTGLRPSEILRLTKDDVQDGCLVIRTSKTGRPRVVPIHPAIKDAVKRLPIGVGYRWIARHFEAARAALGKPDWRIYDLRHTAASWLIQSGADLVTVRDILGHTSLAMTGRYSHLSTEHLRVAVRRVRRYTGKRK